MVDLRKWPWIAVLVAHVDEAVAVAPRLLDLVVVELGQMLQLLQRRIGVGVDVGVAVGVDVAVDVGVFVGVDVGVDA